MSYKSFGAEDLVYSTLVAKPEYRFIVHSGSIYKNNEVLQTGSFSNKVKHISNGEVSFHELNVNRPSGSMVYGFISKDTTRFAYRTISTSQFDNPTSPYGNIITQSYPVKAGLTRIYVQSGPEFDDRTFLNVGSSTSAASNKKYIRALKNVINTRDQFGQTFNYGNLGTSNVNMICVPGIFYGSKIDKGSFELNYYVTGTLVGQVKDSNSDGILVQTTGAQSGSTAGVIIYEQGIALLTGSWDLSEGDHTESYGVGTSPSWLNFGTGIPLIGDDLPSTPTSVISSSYEVLFKGTNRIPTLTMMAHADKGEFNYSNNPSFLMQSDKSDSTTDTSYEQPIRKIKNITKSIYENHSASFESTTFISKVGIYDENKNLIAIATLANPIKKTPNRDYMIKMRIDF